VILAAAAALLLVLLADFYLWSAWRQRVQQVLDSAATEGAFALTRGEAAGPAVRRLLRHWPGVPVHDLTVEQPPGGGFYAGQGRAVRVRLATEHAPSLVGRLTGPIAATVQVTVALYPTASPGAMAAWRVE
jgi:hypothetical protein